VIDEQEAKAAALLCGLNIGVISSTFHPVSHQWKYDTVNIYARSPFRSTTVDVDSMSELVEQLQQCARVWHVWPSPNPTEPLNESGTTVNKND
jgi:hypothetical protein